MEKMIKECMSKFFESNKVNCKSQHGFTRNRSCLTNLLEFFEEVYDWDDKEKAVDVVYLDCAKAFDKVPHQKLDKTSLHYISDKLLKWLTSWLSNRKH